MFDPISPISSTQRRDYEIDDTDLLNPRETDAIAQGEWVVLNTDGKVERAVAAQANIWQVWTQLGDYSAQALGKITVLQLNDYEGETDMFDGGRTYVIGERLAVAAVSIDGVTRSVLTNDIDGADYIVGTVTKSDDDNGGKLRFQKNSPYLND
jgi:hypothetical protein